MRCNWIIYQFFVVISLIFFATCSPLPKHEQLTPKAITPKADKKDLQYRLPNNTLPIRYDVFLTTNVHKNEFKFTGTVKILLKVIENTSNITLNYRQLNFTKVTLQTNTLQLLDSTFRVDKDVEFLIVTPNAQLVKDSQYILDIEYDGILRDDNSGFYRSSYVNAKGDEVYLATTQFEQTDARHAFPCYDEPGIRAVYGFKIKHHNSYTALGNMPGKRIDAEQDYVITTFEDTPRMQTYLIAFVVSDFESISNEKTKTQNQTLQNVYARPQAIANGEAQFALETGVKVIEKLEEHLNQKYDLPKLDQISIPDFAWGAMENWGLVTYKEERLLYNEKITTTKQKQSIAAVIAHEYAHQFFGNLVNPKWWSYNWLNEGFATLFESVITDMIFPEMKMMDYYPLGEVQDAFSSDSLESTRPMTHYVETPAEIEELFDNIAYAKAGSVLRMFQEAFGMKTFTKGLQYYLEAQKLKPTEADDLYREIQNALDEDKPNSGINVREMMRSWELQDGYPVVKVEKFSDKIILTQERFLQKSTKTHNSRWWIPINYATASDPKFDIITPDYWIKGDDGMVIQRNSSEKKWNDDDWLVFNIRQTGYYRVNYDEQLWKLIIKELVSGDLNRIHSNNRAQLIDDALNLAKAEKLNYTIAFDLIQYLKNETEYLPWQSASNGLSTLNKLIADSDYYPRFLEFMGININKTFTDKGVSRKQSDTNFDIFVRNIGIHWACLAGLEACSKETTKIINDVVEKNTQIDPDLQSSIYCSGLRSASEAVYDFFLNKLEKSNVQGERSLLISALACTQNKDLLQKYLEKSLTNTFKLQEKDRVVSSVVNSGKLGVELTLQFLKESYAKIKDSMSPRAFDKILNPTSKNVASENQLKLFNEVLDTLVTNGIITDTDRSNYKIAADANANVRSRIDNDIDNWLKVYFNASSRLVISSFALFSSIVIFLISFKH